MKLYYLIVGLIGVTVCFYVTSRWHIQPWPASFLLGYVPGTLVGAAILMYIKERYPVTCNKTNCACGCRLCEHAKANRSNAGHCFRHDMGCHWKGCSG